MRCIVNGCDSRPTGPDRKSFFRFPKNKSIAKEWVSNLKPFVPCPLDVNTDRICEKHFESNSFKLVFGKKLLIEGVIPTLFELHQLNHTKRKQEIAQSETNVVSRSNGNATTESPGIVRKSHRLSLKCPQKSEVLIEETTETPTKDMVKIIGSGANTVVTNRIYSSTPKAIQLTTGVKRNNTSEETNDRPAKNAKLPFVYALTPSSTGGTVAAQQLTPITRPVTLTKLQNFTTLSGSENRQVSGSNVKLVPGTVIKLGGNKKFTIPVMGANGNLNTGVARRPTIYIKAPVKKTIRTVTEELIAKSPKLHVGLTAERLTILKNVAFQKAKIPFVDLLITLKKLRLNESIALLAEYFEYPESEVEKICSRTIIKLAKYLKFLIRWPDGDKYCERHKNLPISFRSKLSYVQSLIECVETEIRPEASPNLGTADCKFFKFILAITPAGVISYVSEAFVGNHDDLAIFNACNFQNLIPKYLSLVADPGQGVMNHRNEFDTDSTTDSAEETEEHSISDRRSTRRSITAGATSKSNAVENRINNNLSIVNSQLTSSKVKDFGIPTLRVREPACRQQIRDIIYTLREFKILQPYAILEPHLYQYINEILVIVSALTNFKR